MEVNKDASMSILLIYPKSAYGVMIELFRTLYEASRRIGDVKIFFAS